MSHLNHQQQIVQNLKYASRSSLSASRSPLHALRSTLSALRCSPLLLILALFTLLTLYNSVLLPLGEADDETDHYQYLRFVARTGHPPLTEAERQAAGFKGGLAPFYYWLTAWPIALVGEDARPDIRWVDSRPERYIPTDGLGINHVLHTLDEGWPWRGQVLAWHLVRLLSLPLGWLTIIATYVLARRLLPTQSMIALGAATFVAFLPRFVISSAVINDDNLVFALTSLLLLTQVAIIQGDHRRRTLALLGALFGLALVTKYFSLILIPEIIFTLGVYRVARSQVAGLQSRKVTGTQSRKIASRRVARSQDVGNNTLPASRSPLHALLRFPLFAHRSPLSASRPSPLLAFALALILTAGPWFTFITVRFNRVDELGLIPGLAASLGEPQITEGLIGLLSGQSVRPPAATYSLPEWFSLLYRSFWFEYGWMQIFAPGWVYALFTVFLLLAAVGLVRYLLRTASSTQNPQPETASPLSAPRSPLLVPRSPLPASPLPWLLALHLALFLVVVLARYILSATIDTGQGRHLYPALPVIAFLIALGLSNLRFSRNLPPRIRFLLLTPYFLLLTPYFLLLLLPSAFSLQPSSFILPSYRTLPVTITPPAELPITHRQSLTFADGLALAGFDTPEQVTAGNALPVTLYWHAEREAEQDYLLSLCLQDEQARPVACWRGHFADGHYPARAWEAGDTLIDTVLIPIPICPRLIEQTYRLHLQVWPLAPESPRPVPITTEPVLAETFGQPQVAIHPTVSPGEQPPTVELWRSNTRLTGLTTIELGQTITQLTYDRPQPSAPVLASGQATWPAVSQLETPLYLPCDDGSVHLSHFIADPTLAPGIYRSVLSEVALNLSSRRRFLAPIESSLRFAPYLAPLTLQLPDQAALNLQQLSTTNIQPAARTPQPLPPTSSLPITIRWQARQWMADPLVVSLKLLDKDFLIGGERVATLGDRYPNVLWVPSEIVEETYLVHPNPNAPPGLYRLELSVVHQNETLPDGFEYLPLTDGAANLGHNLYPLTVRLLDPTHSSPSSHLVSAHLGDAIQLTGYDLDSPTQNSELNPQNLKLTLYWQSNAPIASDYTVFTQLIGPDGQVWAQWDNPPQAGRYPTSAWTTPDTVVDRYTLTLRPGAPPGEYRLLVGMYDPSTGQRLPVTVDGQPQPDQALELTRLSF